MRQRRYILLLPAIVLSLALVFVVFTPAPEPSYNGRKLSEWAYLYTINSSSSSQGQQAANAIRQIGTNAIPFLLKWISYDPPEWKTKWYPRLNPLLKRLIPKSQLWDQEDTRSFYAMKVFHGLGPKAAGAVEDLGRVMNDPKGKRSAQLAAEALFSIGPKSLPMMLDGLTNKQLQVRWIAVEACEKWQDSLGTNARAVHRLAHCIKDKDVNLALMALIVLSNLKNVPDLVVPALADCLQDSHPRIRVELTYALSAFGQKDRYAVPALLNLLTNSDSETRKEATKALRAIDPKALENATPH